MSDANETLASSGAATTGTADSKIGTWIKEKYRLDSVIGDGGMAIVYAATHRNKKRFAIKMLRAEISTNVEIRTRFLREGYVANTVDHPGVVAVIDDDVTADGCAFLVMELLDGASLEELSLRATDGRLSLRTVLAVTHQLLDVLVAAHAKNVVHRDLKPANLFLTKAGQAKVLDFGIARIREANLTNATQTGHAMGTPAFMAPEQARGKASLIGPRTDLYSTGATMFSLLSGVDVHQGESAQEVVFQAGSTPARSLATAMSDAPPAIVAIVDRALAYAPDDRFPDAATMREAIAKTYSDLFGETLSPTLLVGASDHRVRIAASHPDLAAKISDESARTMAAPSTIETSRTVVQPAQAVPAPAITASAIGHTTEQPVSATSDLHRASPSRSRVPFAVGGVVVVASLITGIFVLGSKPQTAPLSPAAVADTQTSTPIPTTSAVASAIPSDVLVVASASAAPSASSAPSTSARVASPTHAHPSTIPATKNTSRNNSSDFDRR